MRYQKTEKRLAFRANIALLGCYQLPEKAIAAELGTTVKTVSKWLARTHQYGIVGLRDEPRTGRPQIFNLEIQAKVIHLATHPPFDDDLAGFSNISSWLIAWVMEHRQWVDSISQETVRQILRNHRLQVHRVKYWKTSTDPHFLEKMRTIVGLYLNPPPGKLIISVDEMPSIQALERIAVSKTVAPGKPRRIEFEYKRHGTRNLFAALNVKTGEVFGETSAEKKHQDFFNFMKNVDSYWNYQNMIVVVDNYKTHNHHVIKEWLKQQNRRIHFAFTPYHGSWLNQIEIWFGILRRYCLKHVSFKNTKELDCKLLQFIDTWNKNFAHPFKWTFTGW